MKRIFFVSIFFFFYKCSLAQAWSSIGSGMNGQVRALVVYNNLLHAGGAFTSANGVSTMHIASWNNTTWDSLGSGTQFSPILTLCVHNSELIAGGSFNSIGGVATNLVGSWDGITWSAMPGQANTGQIWALGAFNNDVYIGNFYQMYFTKWNGSSTINIGANAPVFAFCVYNGELYAGGTFTTLTMSSIAANGIAKFDGTAWYPIGSGASAVKAMTVYNGELYVAGNFTNAGGVSAGRIAKWNGTNWSAVGSGLGMNAEVLSLCVYNGELYAGGEFTTADGISAAHIAKWNGTNWSAVGSGTDTTVWTMAVYNNELYVGGSFITAGGITCNRIAKWNMLTSTNEEIFAKSINIFPNPCGDKLFIENKSAAKIEKAEVYNIAGQLILVSFDTNELNVNDLNNGVYMLSLHSSHGVLSRRICISKN